MLVQYQRKPSWKGPPRHGCPAHPLGQNVRSARLEFSLESTEHVKTSNIHKGYISTLNASLLMGNTCDQREAEKALASPFWWVQRFHLLEY